jgi:hypothetical protein
VLAEERTRGRAGAFVGVEDLLLAILRQGEGPAYDVLATLHISLEAVRDALRRRFAKG